MKFLLLGAILLLSVQGIVPQETEDGDTKDFNVSILILDAVNILRAIQVNVQEIVTGLTPPVTDIISQMPANTQAFLNALFGEINGLLAAANAEIDAFFAYLLAEGTSLLPIIHCIQDQEVPLGQSFDVLFNSLIECNAVLVNNSADSLSELPVRFNTILTTALTIADDIAPKIVDCLRPGSVDSKVCFDEQIVRIEESVAVIVTEFLPVVDIIADFLLYGFAELPICAADGIAEFQSLYDVWSAETSTCIETTTP